MRASAWQVAGQMVRDVVASATGAVLTSLTSAGS